MEKITSPVVVAELRRLANECGGMLSPENVVSAASSPTSPLHKYFEWDDTEAARRYRLSQAQEILRITVEYLPVDGKREPVRVFVSLTTDRGSGKGSYRITADVASDEQLYAQLLQDAKDDIDVFRKKYSRLKEMEPVLRAMAEVSRPTKKTRRRAA